MSTPAPSASENDLYVGYLPTPRRHRRAMRLLVPTILWGLCAISALIAANLAPAGDAVWDADTTTIHGTLVAAPYPGILHDENNRFTTTFLVESGKHGARVALHTGVGQPITVEGFLLHRDGRSVLELLPGTDGVKPPQGPMFVRSSVAVGLGSARAIQKGWETLFDRNQRR